MASPGGTPEHSLIKLLAKEPHRFSFVQAGRLLELLARQEGFQPIGTEASPAREGTRFQAYAARGFPPNEVISLFEDSDSTRSLTVGFLGLYGPSGVLPHHDTQEVIDEKPLRESANEPASKVAESKDAESTDAESTDAESKGSDFEPAPPRRYYLKDFLDLFNHRTISLFYRASTKYRLPFSYEDSYRELNDESSDKPAAAQYSKGDVIDRVLFSLAGLGTPGLARRLEVPDEFLIEFVAAYRNQPKNAVALEQALTHRFQIPIRVRQFVGQWLRLSDSNVSTMPTRMNALGQNSELGVSFIVGDRVWDVNGKFRLEVGPVGYQEFKSFLPQSRRLTELAQLARHYAGVQFDFDVQLELKADDVPRSKLDGSSQLGYNTWLLSKPSKRNRKDAVFVQSGLPVNGK